MRHAAARATAFPSYLMSPRARASKLAGNGELQPKRRRWRPTTNREGEIFGVWPLYRMRARRPAAEPISSRGLFFVKMEIYVGIVGGGAKEAG